MLDLKAEGVYDIGGQIEIGGDLRQLQSLIFQCAVS
jgi:hypothetical protein